MDKARDLICAAILTYFIPLVSSLPADAAVGTFQGLDPDGVFVWRFLHHIVQALVTGLAIGILAARWRRLAAAWGFNLNMSDWSLGVLWRFCLGCALYSLFSSWMAISRSGLPAAVNHPMTARNVTGNLIFMFTMPGISEEMLFRSLSMAVLARSWRGEIRLPGFGVSSAGFIAAVLFSLAHMGFAVFPFRITHLDPMQMAVAFGLGVFYAVMYERTGSLLGPVLAHNASDGILAAVTYLLRLNH